MTLDLAAINALQSQLARNELVVVAIDPGLSGAVVRLEAGHLRSFSNFKAQRDIVCGVQAAAPADVWLIEDVHAMPGQGVSSMFSFGESTGVARGAVWASVLGSEELQVVAPQRWQNYFWKTVTGAKTRCRIPGNEDGKVEMEEFSSTEIASALFPAFVTTALMKSKRCRGVDHNICDAALIAAWRLLDTAPARFA